jgi:phosphoglycerate dehydrogenase-like enzyme
MLTVLVISDPAAAHVRALAEIADTARLIVTDNPRKVRESAPEAEIIFHTDYARSDLLQQALGHAVRLRWIHLIGTGIENQLFPELISSAVPVTNGRGAFRQSLGEWAIAAMLCFAHDFPRLAKLKQARRWEKFEADEVYGRTLGIVGYGEIGRAAAQRAAGMGMRIAAMRRNAGLDSFDSVAATVFGPDRMTDLLAISDYVLVSAPLTPATRGMIGEREIASMKTSGVMINVGRGPVIDEAALIRALASQRIRGAALDVFDVEPLPQDHPFYSLDNVLLSPHCADRTPGLERRAVQCFLDNFARFRNGETLSNLVDKTAGY